MVFIRFRLKEKEDKWIWFVGATKQDVLDDTAGGTFFGFDSLSEMEVVTRSDVVNNWPEGQSFDMLDMCVEAIKSGSSKSLCLFGS